MPKIYQLRSYTVNFFAATSGSDYVSVTMDVVFPAGSSNGAMQCIDVSITDDSAVEGDETFTVALTTSSAIVTLGNALTTITITNTDGEYALSREEKEEGSLRSKNFYTTTV